MKIEIGYRQYLQVQRTGNVLVWAEETDDVILIRREDIPSWIEALTDTISA